MTFVISVFITWIMLPFGGLLTVQLNTFTETVKITNNLPYFQIISMTVVQIFVHKTTNDSDIGSLTDN